MFGLHGYKLKLQIVEQGIFMKIVRGKYPRRQNRLFKVDDFWKNLIRQTIYGFYQNKIVPTRYAFASA